MTPIPYWPSEFPNPLVQGYTETMASGRIVTQMQRGTPKMRRGGRPAEPRTLTVRLTFDQYQRFRRFFYEDCKDGSLWFYYRDGARDDRAITDESGAPLTDDAGNPLKTTAWELAYFDESQPQATSPGGDLWDVQMAIAVMP